VYGVEALGFLARQMLHPDATTLRPLLSKRLTILPITFFLTASGLMMEKSALNGMRMLQTNEKTVQKTMKISPLIARAALPVLIRRPVFAARVRATRACV